MSPQDCSLQSCCRPGLLPSILSSPQDCSLQSCCHPRIAPFNPVVTPGLRGTPRGTPRELHAGIRKNRSCLFPVPNSTRAAPKKSVMLVSSSELHAGSSEKIGHACFQSRTPKKSVMPVSSPGLHAGSSEKIGHACFQLRAAPKKNRSCLFPVPNSTRAAPKKSVMPVSSSELHAGSNQKMVGACFLTRQPAKSYGSGHTVAVWHLQPAEPAPRSEFFPGFFSSCPPTGQLQLSCGPLCKVSAKPARQSRASPPTWRHAADVSHQLRSSVRLCRRLAPSCAVSRF